MSFSGGFGSGGGGGGGGVFGGFGSNNNTTTSGSLFGGNTATSGGFGSGSGGFGNNNTNSPFGGAKSAFGAPTSTSGGSLFGATSTSGGFGGGGFGNPSNNTTNNTALSTGFGGGNTGSSLFGGNKGASGGFGGASSSTGGGLFGSGTTGGGFGSNTTTSQSNPFGGSTTTTNNPFGGAGTTNTSGGFGSTNTNTNSAFGGGGGSGGGFGGNNAAVNTNQGTGGTPFNAFTEKESNTQSGQPSSSAYQTITMQQPYQNKSLEELRLEDYAQNRRLPQNNSFGTGSTFGGFSSSTNQQGSGGMFGGSANTGGFGNNSNPGFGGSANAGFGSNTSGGGLFGAKAGSASLFGNNTSSATTSGGFGATAGSGGGLFGNTNNASNTGGFGGSTGGGFGSNTSGGGLFGSAQNNQNNQPKSAFGGFGSTNTNANANANNTTNTGFGGFGNNNQQPSQPQANPFGGTSNAGGFGSNTGGGLFGGQNNNQNKAAGTGLFGAATNTASTGTGLFGSNTQQPNAGNFGATSGNTGLFGSNNQSNTAGSLFGGANQNKAGGTGLFGSATGGTNTGGSLFGNNNNTTQGSLFGGANQNNTGGSLFGNQNKQPGNSLFGGNTGNSSLFGGNNANAGNSLFGNTNAQPQGGSLFGGQTQNANAGSSLFGASAQSQPQQNQLTASITGDPYGNAQLFASLASPSPPVGPLATPLSGARPAPRARASLLASVRGGSPMLGASTTLTPRGRPGYGFSYSNYNSPASVSLTPGASSLLRPTGSLGSALTSRLSKSFSTSNLRGDADGSSLLRTPAPGQSSLLLGSGSLGSGNIRRLKIDRSLRTDLFGDTPKKVDTPKEAEKEKEKEKDKESDLRKRVSFDQSAEKDNSSSAVRQSASSALIVRDENEVSRSAAPEMSQAPGSKSLTTVPEEPHTDKSHTERSLIDKRSDDPTPRKPVEAGEYYTEPPLRHVKNMSRAQLSHMRSFTVGRQGVGKIEFGRNGQVDLSSVSLDDICDNIVRLKPRSATVYEDDSEKPPVGRGLNVPSTIYLEQSWPRSTRLSGATPQKSSQKDIDRHKARLKRVGGTKFLDYNDSTGVWSFTVEHFTTYELDDDEETMDDTTGLLDLQPKIPASMRSTSSDLSEPPPTADLTKRSFDSAQDELDSPDFGDQDDTFQFKLAKRSHQSNISLPGGFEDSTANISYDYDDSSADEMQEDDQKTGGIGDAEIEDPFIENAGPVQAPTRESVQHYHDSVREEEEQEVEDIEKELPGSFSVDPPGLKSILKPIANPFSAFDSPEKLAELPWEQQLQRTLSPMKRDRQALKEMQASFVRAQDNTTHDSLVARSILNRSQLGQSYLATKSAKKGKPTSDATMSSANDLKGSQAFRTSMDIMKSLWADEQQPLKRSAFGKVPLSSKSLRPTSSDANVTESDFHDSFKPSFSNDGTLVFSTPGSVARLPSGMQEKLKPIVSEHRDVRCVDIGHSEDSFAPTLLDVQMKSEITEIDVADMEDDDELIMPEATTSNRIAFAELAAKVEDSSAFTKQEKAIWTLCSVLFDPLEVCAAHLVNGMTEDLISEFEARLRVDVFLAFWSDTLKSTVDRQLRDAKSSEEKALLFLSKGDIVAASDALVVSRNVKLATLISQLPGTNDSREIMRQQIDIWRERKDWSEFSDVQRALYSITAGQTCTVAGITGPQEDRVAQFCLSKRFGLTWAQSLALKVQFGGFETLQEAVDAYRSGVDSDEELVKPLPWHGKSQDGEDTLLSLLKITIEKTDVESLLDPMIISGDALKCRLAWQLATILGAKGIARLEDVKMDAVTIDLAFDQEKAGDFASALWTLLHLNDEDSRYIAVKAVLERNGGRLTIPGDDDSFGSFQSIVNDLQIPASLVWTAKALYAQNVRNDAALQCHYLLLAATEESYDEAHKVLCHAVGPKAIIEQQYDELQSLLDQFHNAGTVRFADWATGGQVYTDLVRLLKLPASKGHGREAEGILKKLDRGLEAQREQGERGLTLEMKVARIEMMKLVDEKVKTLDNADKWKGSQVQGLWEQNKGTVMLEKYMAALGQVA